MRVLEELKMTFELADRRTPLVLALPASLHVGRYPKLGSPERRIRVRELLVLNAAIEYSILERRQTIRLLYVYSRTYE